MRELGITRLVYANSYITCSCFLNSLQIILLLKRFWLWAFWVLSLYMKILSWRRQISVESELKSSFWTQVADKSYAVIARCICSYLHACRACNGPVFTRFLSHHIFLVEKINYCILCLIVNLSVLINCRKS